MQKRLLEAFLELGRIALASGVSYSQILSSVMDLETSNEAIMKEAPWQKSATQY